MSSYLDIARRVLESIKPAVSAGVDQPLRLDGELTWLDANANADEPSIELTDATTVWQAALGRLEGNLQFPTDVMEALWAADAQWAHEPEADHACVEAQSISCARCGSCEFRDVPIHGGRSMRRDCARCRRFIEFTVWCGTDRSGPLYTGHFDQQRQ